MGEVQRVRGVDDHLAVEGVAHRLECGQRTAAICRVDQQLRVEVLVRRKGQVEPSPLFPRPGLLRVPRADVTS